MGQCEHSSVVGAAAVGALEVASAVTLDVDEPRTSLTALHNALILAYYRAAVYLTSHFSQDYDHHHGGGERRSLPFRSSRGFSVSLGARPPAHISHLDVLRGLIAVGGHIVLPAFVPRRNEDPAVTAALHLNDVSRRDVQLVQGDVPVKPVPQSAFMVTERDTYAAFI